MYNINDTIVAVSSPSCDKRVIIRITGQDTIETCKQIFASPIPINKSGIICGCLCFFLTIAFSRLFSAIPERFFIVSFGSLAVGTAIFIMAAINYEHPPAVGISLGLVLNQWDHQTIIFIVFAVIIMLVVKKLLQPFLIDLI